MEELLGQNILMVAKILLLIQNLQKKIGTFQLMYK